ncbi:MAG TPA: GH25 family lysozyme [Kofleriaceae bacterium]
MQRTILVVAGVALAAAALTAAALVLRSRGHRGKPERADCHVGPTTPGIDVSYYQEAIDWPRVRRAGIRFAFIRLSDGAALRDPRFAANWAEAGRAGVLRGAYLFFRPDQSVEAQADVMIAALRGRDRGDLPPVLDVEVDGSLAASELAARARAWIDRVRAGLRVEPIVYTGGDLWRNGGADALAAQPLWIAHYTQGCPALPAPWAHWTFWQHTDRGAVPGIDGAVDLDLFAGSLGELDAAR